MSYSVFMDEGAATAQLVNIRAGSFNAQIITVQKGRIYARRCLNRKCLSYQLKPDDLIRLGLTWKHIRKQSYLGQMWINPLCESSFLDQLLFIWKRRGENLVNTQSTSQTLKVSIFQTDCQEDVKGVHLQQATPPLNIFCSTCWKKKTS